ncbi:MAG: ABC transporter permease [Candidatus Nanoarchaeia archaeon]|jgi:ABC-type multidrug transport system permease subunit|nr:ABC transporter permease [Candidatus Nanoarchaeia archaeon]|tara:strand:+ start:18663 stop:20243 length:1581 start_codon:yes stop_codon:yes gene_type:complete
MNPKDINPINFFLRVVNVILKDLKLLVRSKSSALIIVLGPLILIFLVGMAFNTSSLYNIKIVTYSESYSDLTNSLVENLKNQQYTVVKIDSEKECIDSIKLGESHVCAVFPKDMDVEQNNELIFYVDESRVSLAAIISNTIFSEVASKAEEVSLSLTGELLTSLKVINEELAIETQEITTLKDETSKINSDVKNIREELQNLDLVYNASLLNFSAMNDEMDSIIADLNISKRKFDDLEDLIDDSELEVGLLGQRLTAAKDKRESFVKTLDTSRSALLGFFGKTNKIQESIDRTKRAISGVRVTDAETIVNPITSTVKPITSDTTHLSFLFPTLVVLVIMFISLLFSASVVIREKKSRAYFRNFITPTNDFTYTIGAFFTNLILVVIELGILFVVALYFFSEELLNVFPTLSVALLVIASVFILMGMFIGYLFNSGETASLGSIAVSFIMLFFSNTLLPLESLPNYIREIVKFNPFVISESIIKRILLFNAGFDTIMQPLLFLLGGALIFFILGFLARELTKRKLIV